MDSSRHMVRMARRQSNPANGTFRRGNVLRLPFPDDSFDLVTALNAPLVLREVDRVLRPDGQVLVSHTFAGGGDTGLADAVCAAHGLASIARSAAGAHSWALLERHIGDLTGPDGRASSAPDGSAARPVGDAPRG